MKDELMKKRNKLKVQKFENLQSSEKKSAPDSLQNFSPNPGKYQHVYMLTNYKQDSLDKICQLFLMCSIC